MIVELEQSGLPLQYCETTEDLTQASFNQDTGEFSLSTTDMVTYTPGNYSLTITVSSGAKNPTFVVDFELVNPCFDVDLNMQENPFKSESYVIFDQAQS